jgi:4-carboxymuconolactone decarboxylase
VASNPSVPAAIREIAILVTGAHFKAPYEIYAHEIVAKRKGLSDEKVAAIVEGRRPSDLTREERSRTSSRGRWCPAACCLS